MLFRPRYPLSFEGPFNGCGGGPSVLTAPNPRFGELVTILQSGTGTPVVCNRLSSYGVDAGVPRDERTGRSYQSRSVIQVGATVRVNAFFAVTAMLADASVRSWMKILIEEFAPDGSYRGSAEGSRTSIADVGGWFFNERRRWTVDHRIAVTADLVVNPGSHYRAWVDLEGDLAAAGFTGRIGGSSVRGDVFATVESVNVFYYLAPGIY